jgi:hypothetical protein
MKIKQKYNKNSIKIETKKITKHTPQMHNNHTTNTNNKMRREKKRLEDGL